MLDFELPVYDGNGLGEVAFSFNSALGTYLISYIVMDLNGTPYIYEHKFKISSNEDFESSLTTNVYTLKTLEEENGVYVVFNDNLEPTSMSSYPNETLENKMIFEIVEGDISM